MSWLSGKPRRTISLHWPENDPLIQQCPVYEPPGTWSVLDDQVLRAFIVRKPNELSSAVYLANIHEVIVSGGTTAVFVKIATLPNAVHRVSLLPDRKGFASLEFNKDSSSITLRIHDWDGTISKERIVHAAAAYGDLVVNRYAVAICVSSGQPAPREMYLAGSPDVYHRVDAYSLPVPPDPSDLTGDFILVWMVDSDTLTSVQIPQDDNAPLIHQANFQFTGYSHLALGGKVVSSFGRPSALLKAFHIDKPSAFSRTFTHGENFEMDDDIGVIAKPGSSSNNAIVVNYHHLGSRLTVADNGLLSGDLDSEPSSDDPPGLHAFYDHPGFSRTIQGTVNGCLPSISDNRLLVGLRIEPEDEGFKKFAVQRTRGDDIILFLYDFDQARCNELCSLTAVGRTSLESVLRTENKNAQVSVVERNFYVSIEEEVDTEWLPGSRPPQEWTAHFRKLHEIGEARKKGTAETPVLQFDEAPDEQKGNLRILFAQSAIWLPEETDIRAIDFNQLALTTSGIVHVPHPEKVGHFFYFGDP